MVIFEFVDPRMRGDAVRVRGDAQEDGDAIGCLAGQHE